MTASRNCCRSAGRRLEAAAKRFGRGRQVRLLALAVRDHDCRPAEPQDDLRRRHVLVTAVDEPEPKPTERSADRLRKHRWKQRLFTYAQVRICLLEVLLFRPKVLLPYDDRRTLGLARCSWLHRCDSLPTMGKPPFDRLFRDVEPYQGFGVQAFDYHVQPLGALACEQPNLKHPHVIAVVRLGLAALADKDRALASLVVLLPKRVDGIAGVVARP